MELSNKLQRMKHQNRILKSQISHLLKNGHSPPSSSHPLPSTTSTSSPKMMNFNEQQKKQEDDENDLLLIPPHSSTTNSSMSLISPQFITPSIFNNSYQFPIQPSFSFPPPHPTTSAKFSQLLREELGSLGMFTESLPSPQEGNENEEEEEEDEEEVREQSSNQTKRLRFSSPIIQSILDQTDSQQQQQDMNDNYSKEENGGHQRTSPSSVSPQPVTPISQNSSKKHEQFLQEVLGNSRIV